MMKQSTLYIFSGLPATGKSTLAKELAKKLRAVLIRIDTVEQGLREVCNLDNIEGEGYRLSYRVVADNLRLGNDVIADSVNPWELTRKEWNEVASTSGARYVNIEVICSDQQEHRKRVEERKIEIPNMKLPTWEEVIGRDYHQWNSDRIVIDTALKNIEVIMSELLQFL